MIRSRSPSMVHCRVPLTSPLVVGVQVEAPAERQKDCTGFRHPSRAPHHRARCWSGQARASPRKEAAAGTSRGSTR